jgi:hypothetical protein
LQEILVTVQKLIAHSRPLQPSDLMLPELTDEKNYEYKEEDKLKLVVEELEESYDYISNAFHIKHNGLTEEFWEALKLNLLLMIFTCMNCLSQQI